VLEGGRITVGDTITVVEEDPRSVGKKIADRLRSTVR
jgi:MOSC domain-containing protein YiiM